mgnify:CR=1 FL=1
MISYQEIVMAAVMKQGNALRFATDRLKDDEEIVIKAIESRSESFQYASERL